MEILLNLFLIGAWLSLAFAFVSLLGGVMQLWLGRIRSRHDAMGEGKGEEMEPTGAAACDN